MATTPVERRQEMSPEQFEQHRQKELERRAEFRTAYPVVAQAIEQQIVKNLPSDLQPEAVIKTAGVDEQSDEKINEVNKVHRTMAEVGTIPVTIVNLLPWEVVGAGTYWMWRTIPACPIGQEFETFVVKNYIVDIEDKGGRFGASPMTPITLARDLMSQMAPLKRGGLFMYMGDHRPGEAHRKYFCPACGAKKGQACRENVTTELPDGRPCPPHPARPEAESFEKELKLWEAAKKEMRINMQRLFRYAEQESQQHNRAGYKNITEMNRLATQWLHYFRYLKEMPAWMAETRAEDDIPDRCENCHAEVAGDPIQCLNCAYVVNPEKGYLLGELDEDHHSLRRLSREKLDGMGLTHILTLAEWRISKAGEAVDHGTRPVGESLARSATGGRRGLGKRASQVKPEKPEDSIDPLAHIPAEDPAEKKGE